jgi:hypothetical protein
MTTQADSLRPGPGLASEDKTVVKLAGFNEDFVAKHEVSERGHHRRRGLLEHLDDDDAIVLGLARELACYVYG